MYVQIYHNLLFDSTSLRVYYTSYAAAELFIQLYIRQRAAAAAATKNCYIYFVWYSEKQCLHHNGQYFS